MKTSTTQKRFTLSLPGDVHTELTRIATTKGISSREVIIKSLKLGMIAFETEGDLSKELVIKEKIDNGEIRETRLILI